MNENRVGLTIQFFIQSNVIKFIEISDEKYEFSRKRSNV